MESAPKPREVNDVAIVTTGLGLWVIALIAAVIFGANSDVIGVCAAGIGLGLWGLRYVRRRRRRMTASDN